jgi:hypothetical protein
MKQESKVRTRGQDEKEWNGMLGLNAGIMKWNMSWWNGVIEE